jgi:flagellar biosynthesis/type III secretory pathway protein FliH
MPPRKTPAKKAAKKAAKKVAAYNQAEKQVDAACVDRCAQPTRDQIYRSGYDRGFFEGKESHESENKYSRLLKLSDIRDSLNRQIEEMTKNRNNIQAEIEGLKTEVATRAQTL